MTSLEAVLTDIEAARHAVSSPPEHDLEASLSINDWADRIKDATILAHASARSGDVEGEYRYWIDVASISTARAQLLWEIISETPA